MNSNINFKEVNFVVTDLDDTIWDWLTMWYSSFNPFLEGISTSLGIDKKTLKDDFKKLHQKYGTTEASFLFKELNSIKPNHYSTFTESTDQSKSLLHQYNSNKKKSLKLYKGVLKTLKEIKDQGTLIIGFTESNSFFTKYRLKTLKLDGIFDYIYAPVDFELPSDFTTYYQHGFWEPEKTEFRYLSKTIKKPDSEILDIILKDFKAKKENTIYIGDKLDRDISMAQGANITSVYAQYGHKIAGQNYDLLKEVTHWTDGDVERERLAKQKFHENPKPDFVINSFPEILLSFKFTKFDSGNFDNEKAIEAWKKSIDVQQHFNDLALRIKSYALTLFTAIIGAVGLLERDKVNIILFGATIEASALVSILGFFVLWGFIYMDKAWYHRLLLGAVNHSMFIEKKYRLKFPEFGLSTSISASSPHKIFFFKAKIRSKQKFWFFYAPLLVSLAFVTIGLLVHSKQEIGSKEINSKVATSSTTDTIVKKDKGIIDTQIIRTRSLIRQSDTTAK